MSATVQVVFCMDTEGPCDDPGRPELLAGWPQVDAAMDKLFDPPFRSRYPDPAGGGLRIGWFFLTWTGFRTNPRGRAFGFHAVRDHYLERWGDLIRDIGDEHCWHYHHPPATGVGNEWGLDWSVGDEYAAILTRQVLEREWFPACFRAGGTIMDAASSRWIDRWFPFDYSSRAPLAVPGVVDWSEGVAGWSLYHPDPADFRRPGVGRRRMARCLDLETNVYSLTEADIEQAFAQARSGRQALLSCFDHDYRDIAERVDEFRAMLAAVAARYPDVDWRYGAPGAAIQGYLDVPPPPRLDLDASHLGGTVSIRSSAPLFQSIPWIAVRTADGEVDHVETDVVRLEPTRWEWSPPEGLDWLEAGIAGTTDLGASAVAIIRPDDGPGAYFRRRRTERSPTRPRSIWEHSKYFVELCDDRASGRAEEMDAVRQAVDYLAPRLEVGMSVLDVGCAAGHLERSLRALGVDYHGIDTSPQAVDIGRQYLREAGLSGARLRELAIEDLPQDEEYDAVVCLSTLLYFPMFHLPLEAMARACRRWLVIRSSFGERTMTRYLPDAWLEPEFETLRTYVNVFSRDEVSAFLEVEGFAVSWAADQRQRERFGGAPEVVGGIELPYEFLFGERIAARPSDEELLGDEFSVVARRWREQRGDR